MSKELPDPTLCQLDTLGCIRLSGPDTVKFLQGQISINAAQIAQGQLSLGAICNPQGRCVALFWATLVGEDILLLQLQETIDATISHLSKYAVFFKTKITDASADYTCFGSINSNLESLSDSPTSLESHPLLSISKDNLVALYIVDQAELNAFTASQPAPNDANLWFAHLAEHGIPWLTKAGQNEFLPHNLDLPRLAAVDFKKGCFTGQEVIARMQYKGKLKSHLRRLRGQIPVEQFEASNLTAKTRIFAEQDNAGEVICSVQSEMDVVLILALLKDNLSENENFRLHEPNGPILSLIPEA